MSISLGLSMSGGEMNRVRASRTMDTQRAMRKTALKKAPRISARTHLLLISLRDPEDKGTTQTYTKGELVGGGLLRGRHSPQANSKRDNIIELRGRQKRGQFVDTAACGQLTI